MNPKKAAPSAKSAARRIAQRQAEAAANAARTADGLPARFPLNKPFRAAKVVRRSGCCK